MADQTEANEDLALEIAKFEVERLIDSRSKADVVATAPFDIERILPGDRLGVLHAVAVEHIRGAGAADLPGEATSKQDQIPRHHRADEARAILLTGLALFEPLTTSRGAFSTASRQASSTCSFIR